MAFILNIETATKNCSVAIAKDGETLLCKEIAEQGYSHAEKLHVFIDEILKGANLKFSDLNAIAVSQGRVLIPDCASGFLLPKACAMR
ncbi:tRNA threonylcarbamoyladenosine biosynthesis protein TsaB [Flavobacterium sp. 3HN19-14]|uniref:tRNA threonylcarbamoyladenosine biosynthesis protein TsaB n=1 Tax=Flavobacterium sp. 3HN19-14 TaxID=3448133 RepID=UPI003EE33863